MSKLLKFIKPLFFLRYLLFCFFLLNLYSCGQEEVFEFPLVFTGDVTDIDTEGATLYGKVVDVNLDKIITYGFAVDSSEGHRFLRQPVIYTIDEPVRAGVIKLRLEQELKQGVQYFVRAFATYEGGVYVYGKEVSFKLLPN